METQFHIDNGNVQNKVFPDPIASRPVENLPRIKVHRAYYSFYFYYTSSQMETQANSYVIWIQQNI